MDDVASEPSSKAPQVQTASVGTQTLSTTPISVNYEFIPTAQHVPEVVSYSKAIQTSEIGSPPRRRRSIETHSGAESDSSYSPSRSPRKLKARSRRERERDEELRQNLRREIEEELKASQKQVAAVDSIELKYPARPLTDEELNAVTASDDFLDFVEKSSKVIERALDQDYNVLADYGLEGVAGEESDEDGIRQIAQFYDERWSKKRMISDIDFSPRVSFNYSLRIVPLTPGAVSGAGARLIYQESFGSCRSCRPTTSLEFASEVTTRIHFPFNFRSPHRPILPVPPVTADRGDVQRADPPLGHSISFRATISEDTPHGCS